MIKKILYITDVRLPTEKAHGIQIMKSCEAFSRAGIEVELVIPNRSNPIKQDSFEYYEVEKTFKIIRVKSLNFLKFEKILGPFAFRIQALSFIKNLPKIAPNPETLIYTRSVGIARSMALKGLKVAYEAHIWPENYTWLHKAMLRFVTYIICNSKGTENEYKKAGYKNTLSVPNGVDLKKFSGVQKSVELLKKLNLPADKKIIMYTGHLYEWKGVDTILETAMLCLNYPQIVFVLVGGTDKDINIYKNKIEASGLNNIILSGHREQRDIPMYLACADVLLLPNVPVSIESEKYTSPIKMFEYMASGKPIVASDLPSIREILNSDNAILVKPADPKELVVGIKKALENEEHTKNMVGKALWDVQNFTWEKRAQKILERISK